jgi:uncharacterized protein (TIGR00255 family)
MTGYGKAEGLAGQRKYSVEIRSLNSKQLDLNLRLPSQFREMEMELRNYLTQRIQRGKVDAGIFYDPSLEGPKSQINKNALLQYYAGLKEVADSIGQKDVDYMSLLVRIPDAFVQEWQDPDEGEWMALMELATSACNALDQYRDTEGSALERDFLLRIRNILQGLDDLAGPAEARIERIREKLKGSLEDFTESEKIDRNRFEQELVYYLEKIDITEEKVRLKSNCDLFLRELGSPESQGKKLGFIAQEIGREINTIGSKANDAEIQRIVVYMKDELEKIKEQVLNVL